MAAGIMYTHITTGKRHMCMLEKRMGDDQGDSAKVLGTGVVA